MQNDTKGNGMIWVIMIVVIVVLVLAGLYFYKSKSNPVIPTAIYQQTQTSSSNLESDLSSIDISSTNNDFDALDKDLQSL